MELHTLLPALSLPRAFPHPPGEVRVIQTHLSVVFLADDVVYKIKKPVDVGFANFTTLQSRQFFCAEELRLNRRLAAPVYLGVVPVTRGGGGLRFEGDGEPVEWAVKMKRLPEEASLQQRLRAGQVDQDQVEQLAGRIAAFHQSAAVAPGDYQSQLFENVARTVAQNFAHCQPLVGRAVLPAILERLRQRTNEELARLEPLLRRRGAAGVVRDTHGDLRLDHIYHFPHEAPPGDLVVIDCIEFNEQFRYADPVADAAFLAMDLLFHGRPDLARVFVAAYFRASGDQEGRDLMRFFAAYRAVVRGMVEGITLDEAEVPEADKPQLRDHARAHFLLALTLLDTMKEMPCLVLIGGLPGSGKSTLARALAEADGFAVLRSDEIRKQLISDPAARYTEAATAQTYQECLRRARALVEEGRRVIVDATFRHEAHRRLFLDSARRWGVPALFLACDAAPEVIEQRLAARRNDISDADWKVYQQLAREWEAPGPETAECHHRVLTEEPILALVAQATQRIATELRNQTLRE